MADHFKVGMAYPMTDGSLGTGEEVVEDSNFMAEHHKTVNEMGSDKTGTTSDQDALALRRRKELDGRETTQCCIRDRIRFRVVNRLGLVHVNIAAGEPAMVIINLDDLLLLGIGRAIRSGLGVLHVDIVGAEVEGAHGT